MSGATPALPTNRGVYCINMYTAGPPSGHPCMQAAEGGQWWMLTGTAVRFELGILYLATQQANVLIGHTGW